MAFEFIKISAKDFLFIETKEAHKESYAFFKEYAENLTAQSRKAQNNKSGKAVSYANYLIRLIIFYEKFFDEKIDNLLTFKTVIKIEKVIQNKNFKKYNRRESHFPSATFNCYMSYVTHLNAIKEEKIDIELNENLYTISNKVNTTIDCAQKKENKVKKDGILTYPRNRNESLEAKRRSKWQCEFDSNHTTFTSYANKNQYMESHHLVPMSAQDYFYYTLDYADNIVCLCPNCHRKIHYAINKEKKEILNLLFNKREKNITNMVLIYPLKNF